MKPLDLYIPGREININMNIAAFVKFAAYVMENKAKFKAGDIFNIEGTDKKKLKILLS